MTAPRVQRPSLEAAVGRHGRSIRDDERTPGEWIVVGTYPGDAGTVPESPPFLNGYSNSGVAGVPPVSFYLDKRRRVRIRGAPAGGTPGTPIFALPEGYRPRYSERFACAGAGVLAIVQVDPNGDVTQVT